MVAVGAVEKICQKRLIDHSQHKSQEKSDVICYRYYKVDRSLRNCLPQESSPLFTDNHRRRLLMRVVNYLEVRNRHLAIPVLVGFAIQDSADFQIEP